MCGIVGYVGKNKNALHVLIEGLKSLEYRGYDSAGVAINNSGTVKIIKSEGKISNLEEKIDFDIKSNLGIGHTRWATHGKPSEVNSHPHSVGKITLVHNGIIENYEELKNNLKSIGYVFKTDTDTEVACALIDKIYNDTNDKLLTMKKANEIINGSFAFGIIFDDDMDNLYSMRKDSPLIIALGKDENYIASDVPAILKFTNKYMLLEKDEYAVISQDNIKVFDNNFKEINKNINTYEGSMEVAMKNGYEHFMLKEINDEPKVIKDTYKQFINNDLNDIIEKMPDLDKYENIDIVACGSAYHAGLVGKTLIEEYANIPVNVELASEYRYKKNFCNNKTLTILVSQSGETADTLAALRKAKNSGTDTLGIINVVGSSIAREADNVLYIKAGPEISVATTKAYSAQVLMLSLIAINKSIINGNISKEDTKKLLEDLKKLPNEITNIVNRKDEFDKIASQIYNNEDVFFLGRGIDYALSMEGSLKLKEISYIHSEAYAAGELKHGTISLIEPGTPVIAIVTDENIDEKTVSNIKEVKARGADVTFITTEKLNKKYNDSDFYDRKIVVPNINKFFQPLLTVLPLQLLSYEVAKLRGESIDQPRNLAKSVTVE